jgi:flavodoxin
MKRALIIYHSKTGTTKKIGSEIARICKENYLDTKVISIVEFNKKELNNADFLFLGCWTHGHFLFNQHPDKNWIKFANQ